MKKDMTVQILLGLATIAFGVTTVIVYGVRFCLTKLKEIFQYVCYFF